ncbi:hypothetical protein [Nocardia colli]|uniref:hypothetical protein n=1 Tax=Nocardia colli TaxID=2545717 RepID=UPI0035E061AD
MKPEDLSASNLKMPSNEPIFSRSGNAIIFNQVGVKLMLPMTLPTEKYFDWLDEMTSKIKTKITGAEIAEKPYARTSPRLNTGVYYDTPDRDLLSIGAVLRTTCNKITHAFCAFKQPADTGGVRRDRRHVFSGTDKQTIQNDPTSAASVGIVTALLARTDIEHPGVHLRGAHSIDPTTLTPSIRIAQLRHPFFVWLDGKDALRCVMDRATVTDLRNTTEDIEFLELELPIYPRITPDVAQDPRTLRLIEVLADEAIQGLSGILTERNKYQRAAEELRILH